METNLHHIGDGMIKVVIPTVMVGMGAIITNNKEVTQVIMIVGIIEAIITTAADVVTMDTIPTTTNQDHHINLDPITSSHNSIRIIATDSSSSSSNTREQTKTHLLRELRAATCF